MISIGNLLWICPLCVYTGLLLAALLKAGAEP